VPAAQAPAFKHRYAAVRQICFGSRYSDLVSLVREVFAFRHHQMMPTKQAVLR
jgi:GTP-dependent phosphoenolpyruvate carboxykinase